MALNYTKAREALEAGDRLFVTHPSGGKPNERTIYGLLEAQKIVSLTAYRRLLPDLVPIDDGLFGESQCFSLRQKDRG